MNTVRLLLIEDLSELGRHAEVHAVGHPVGGHAEALVAGALSVLVQAHLLLALLREVLVVHSLEAAIVHAVRRDLAAVLTRTHAQSFLVIVEGEVLVFVDDIHDPCERLLSRLAVLPESSLDVDSVLLRADRGFHEFW